jgi:uncharacterized membrane protein YedE/YeeE
MEINELIETFGDKTALSLAGLLIGIGFGFFAQRSRFCLRSAVVEFWNRHGTAKLAIWLLAFSTAVIVTQLFISGGLLDVSQARQLAATGSISGAIIGGLLFGIGMILARGCSSRMLVLAANGNLRALLTGLIFAVTAQASLNGLLSPLRQWLSGLWTIEGSSRDLLASAHLGHGGGIVFGAIWLVAGIVFVLRSRLRHLEWLSGIGVGLMVALAWLATYQFSTQSFDIVPVQSLSFTGPSADILMLVLSPPGQPWNFNIGLVPGVVLGSFIAALIGRELKLEGFKDGHSYAPLPRRRGLHGLRRHAGRRLRGRRRRLRRRHLRPDRLAVADRHLARSGSGQSPDRPARQARCCRQRFAPADGDDAMIHAELRHPMQLARTG